LQKYITDIYRQASDDYDKNSLFKINNYLVDYKIKLDIAKVSIYLCKITECLDAHVYEWLFV